MGDRGSVTSVGHAQGLLYAFGKEMQPSEMVSFLYPDGLA